MALSHLSGDMFMSIFVKRYDKIATAIYVRMMINNCLSLKKKILSVIARKWTSSGEPLRNIMNDLRSNLSLGGSLGARGSSCK